MAEAAVGYFPVCLIYSFLTVLNVLQFKLTLFSCPVELIYWRTRSGYPKRLNGEADPPLPEDWAP